MNIRWPSIFSCACVPAFPSPTRTACQLTLPDTAEAVGTSTTGTGISSPKVRPCSRHGQDEQAPRVFERASHPADFGDLSLARSDPRAACFFVTALKTLGGMGSRAASALPEPLFRLYRLESQARGHHQPVLHSWDFHWNEEGHEFVARRFRMSFHERLSELVTSTGSN